MELSPDLGLNLGSTSSHGSYALKGEIAYTRTTKRCILNCMHKYVLIINGWSRVRCLQLFDFALPYEVRISLLPT